MKGLAIIGQILLGLLVGTLLSLAVLIGISYGAEAPYKFRTLVIPLQFTFLGERQDNTVRLTDLNDKGEMVGNDFAGNGFFINKKNRTTEIRCLGDQTDNDSTTVSAINNRGQVVGSCTDGAFVRDRNGNITILNFPGAEDTVPSGINDSGHVVGQYWGSSFGQGLQRFHGFIWKDGVYTNIDAQFSEAMFTSLWGINNTGQIVGSTYDSAGKPQFFLYDSGEYFVITGAPDNLVDGGSSWGLNDKSEITGTYTQRLPCDACGLHGEPGFRF